MDSTTRQELLNILCPLMRSEAERRALLNHALENNALLHRLDLTGATESCVSNMIDQLIDFGEISSGRPALRVLLETAHDRVGVDKQARIDAVLSEIYPDRSSDNRRSQEEPMSKPTVESVLSLFERLNPRDQLDQIMLRLGMPAQFRPAPALRLDQREAIVVEWATKAEGGLEQLDNILRTFISPPQ